VSTLAASGAGGERAAATRIAGELGDLIRKIGPETLTAAEALRAVRVSAPGQPLRVPAAVRAVWRRRGHDIDQAHVKVSGVQGADAVRKAALHVLDVLRAACRAGELALTSSTAATRDQHAKQQHAEGARLHAAIQTLTVRLRQAGATHL
jgi:hypothetical protein